MEDLSRPSPVAWRIAHRGARDEAPENTGAAFERALRYPIDGIELDIRMSADGVPVICHDATLWRVARRRRRVAEQTHAQLMRVDWGKWFHKNFSGEPLLTLDQTLARYGARTRLLLEIKSSPADRTSGHAKALTRAVIQLLQQTRYGVAAENFFILSFDPDLLQLAHRLAPGGKYVLNVPQRRPERMLALLPSTDHLWAVCAEIGTLSEALVTWSRTRGLGVFTYTCNGPRQVLKARRLGVDAILTDRPGWLTHI